MKNKAKHCLWKWWCEIQELSMYLHGRIMASNILSGSCNQVALISVSCEIHVLRRWNNIRDFHTHWRDNAKSLQTRIQGRWNGWIFTPLFLSPPPPLFFFSFPSNIDWFYYIITKIHPPPPISKSWIRVCFVGGAVASTRLRIERPGLRATAGRIVPCPWTRHFILTVPLFT